ncbi:MAG: hypothetical protein IT204_24010 [Fimbriimonadaceae bacterium]|nr:hypothetical protein [Fimbriimonadaceae bacterium]
MRLRTGLAAFLALLPLRAAEPPLAPPLTVAPLNREGDPFEILRRTKGNALILFATTAAAGEPSENTARLLAFAEAYHEAREEDSPEIFLVLLGDPARAPQVRDYIRTAELSLPVALLDPAAEQVRKWKLPAELQARVVICENSRQVGAYDDFEQLKRDLAGPG